MRIKRRYTETHTKREAASAAARPGIAKAQGHPKPVTGVPMSYFALFLIRQLSAQTKLKESVACPSIWTKMPRPSCKNMLLARLSGQRLYNKGCTTKIAQQRLHNKDCTTTIAQQRLHNDDCFNQSAVCGPRAGII